MSSEIWDKLGMGHKPKYEKVTGKSQFDTVESLEMALSELEELSPNPDCRIYSGE